MSEQRCKNCWFYSEFDENHLNPQEDNWGFCRRYPPNLNATSDNHAYESGGWCFPCVTEGDWCGEWQHRSHLAEFEAAACPVCGNFIPRDQGIEYKGRIYHDTCNPHA